MTLAEIHKPHAWEVGDDPASCPRQECRDMRRMESFVAGTWRPDEPQPAVMSPQGSNETSDVTDIVVTVAAEVASCIPAAPTGLAYFLDPSAPEPWVRPDPTDGAEAALNGPSGSPNGLERYHTATERLTHAQAEVLLASAERARAVEAMRDEGLPWEQIVEVTGISRQRLGQITRPK